MANYNKPNGNKKSIGVIIMTLIFAIIGTVCIIIGYRNEFVSWLKTFGVVIIVLVSPIFIWISYKLIIDKIKGI